ncbi:ATP-grasp domain-containing protein [Micromonospora sp. NPDC005305]|uniref:ATP-grasp domain-containing protein n=1 Tax=Micromonospora sp. NPDC005305 TaxID=3156875 RepID=UPI0033BD16BA
MIRKPAITAVLFVGGQRTEALTAARRAGLRVLYLGATAKVTDRHRECVDRMVLLDDVTDELLVEAAVALHASERFGLAVTASERFLLATARINEELGLAGNPLSAVVGATDKWLMRSTAAAGGAGAVAHAAVRTTADLHDLPATVGLPMILKPPAGTGSRDIRLVHSAEEFRQLPLPEPSTADQPVLWLAEEYLAGRELSVETLSFAGQHHVLAVTEKFVTPNFVEVGHVIPGRVSAEEHAAISAEVSELLTALGVREGPAHTEVKLTGRGPRVIETHTRPAGDAIVELVRLAAGYDLHELTYAWLAGKPVDLTPHPVAGAAAIWFVTLPEGRVSSARGSEQALAAPGVQAAVLTARPGDPTRPPTSSADRYGHVIAVADDAGGAVRRARAAVGRFVIDVTPAPAGRAGDDDRPLLFLIGSGGQVWREYLLREMAGHYRVHLLSPTEASWQRPYLVASTVVDTLDTEAMLRVVAASPETVVGVVAYEETRVESAAAVATALGLPSSPVAAVHACRDKFASRRALRAAGVPQAESEAVADLPAAMEAAERIGYPVVVKPRALAASCGVTLVPAADQLPEAFDEATRIWFDEVPTYDRPVLIEEYLDGPEISVDSVCQHGKVTMLFIARKQLGYPPSFEEVGHCVDGGDPLLDDPHLRGVVEEAHEAVGLTDSITHMELRLTSAGPRVVELNARIGGGLIPYLGGLATGISVGRAAGDLAMGTTASLMRTRSRVAAVRFLYPPADLTVESVDVHRHRLPAGIRDVRVLVKPGDRLRLPPTDHVRCRCALVVAEAATRRECDAALARAAEAVLVNGSALT